MQQNNAPKRRRTRRKPNEIRSGVVGNTADSESATPSSTLGSGTTGEMLLNWFRDGERHGNDWMLIIADQHTGREFPTYVSPNKSLTYFRNLWSGKTHKILATYDLSKPFSNQSDSFRAVRATIGRKR